MSQPRPAKRARPSHRGEDDYRPGSIVEIEVQNFMTYTHLKSQPGPRLNLVIGPNGTGKSSLVCAIGIGLAGEPQLLGRAHNIGDFVKRGEESGWIKISLRGDSPDEVLVITRKINKRNKSEWLFNDQTVTKKDIQEKVGKYNIQLNNLTQFLPQDRVCEFAKLTPVQLLEETEKAVGNPDLPAQHKTLIQRSEEMKKIVVALTSHEGSLAHVKASNAELEEDKQRMYQRTQLLEEAARMRKKVPWLKYEEKKAVFLQARDAEGCARSVLQKLQERNRALKASFEPLRSSKDKAKGAVERLKKVKEQNEQKLHEVAGRETELAAKVRTKLTEIQDLHRNEALRQEKIQKAQSDVGLAEAELENLPVFTPPQDVLRELRAQIETLHMEGGDKRGLIQEKEALFLQKRQAHDLRTRRLVEINSVKTRLLQALKYSAPQITDAYEWVASHRDQFKSEVFGPVLLEVKIANKEHATYVENQVAGHIWKAFITQDVDDRDLLVRNLKHFDVPVINQTRVQPRHAPRVVTPEMERLGITTRLDEVIVAPPVVKAVLIGQAGLDNSFIGTSATNRRADEAPRLGVRDLWTPENHYRWQESRYGGHISASVNAVRPARLFSENVDMREKNDLELAKAQLERDMNDIESGIRDYTMQYKMLENERAKLERQRQDIHNQSNLEKKKRQDLMNIIEQRRRRLRSLENGEGSEDAERRLRAVITEVSAQRVQNLAYLKELLTEIVHTHLTYAPQHLSAIELDAKVKEMESNVRKEEAEAQDAQRRLVECSQVTETCQRQLAIAKDLAQQDGDLTRDLQEKFKEMPDTIAELEDAIADHEAQAAAVICNNENAILIYEQRCEEIRNLTLKVEEKRNARDQCLKEIETIKGLWLPELRDLVSNINKTFSKNFMEMAVAGEVSLDEQGTDFDQYGILIKVKFRESGGLQVLSAHHQSGGERSVSTILYLVSLQDLTYCPFRVVDEINQGMDPTNERKMFQQLVRAASQLNTPQCLLLTPKLLPDLEYSEACSILNIMNGPWIEEASNSRWRDGVSWSVMSQMISSQ